MRELDYEGAYDYLTRYARHFRSWPIDQEDLVHEAFLYAYRKYTWPVPRSLLWTVLRYRAIDLLAKLDMREKYIPWSLDLGWEVGESMAAATSEPPYEARERLEAIVEQAHTCLLLYIVLPPALYTSDEALAQVLGVDVSRVKVLREDARRVLNGRRPVSRGHKRLEVLASLAGY